MEGTEGEIMVAYDQWSYMTVLHACSRRSIKCGSSLLPIEINEMGSVKLKGRNLAQRLLYFNEGKEVSV